MSRKLIFITSLLVVLILGVLTLQGELFLHDGKLHVIFCNVGQGDGIIIKSPGGKILLFDGGPDDSFGTCLSRVMPFWDKTINLMMISHPHADHFLGDIGVLQRYHVLSFASEKVSSDQKAYQLLLSLLHDKSIHQQLLSLGDQVKVGELRIAVLGPSDELVARSSPHGQIGESKEFGSLLLLVQLGNLQLLLPGDSQVSEMHEAIEKFGLGKITILQSPHHGSATGIDPTIVSTLKPDLAVISVGAHNRYGHPSPSTLSVYEKAGVPVKRTDHQGTIEIVSDGSTYSVRNW